MPALRTERDLLPRARRCWYGRGAASVAAALAGLGCGPSLEPAAPTAPPAETAAPAGGRGAPSAQASQSDLDAEAVPLADALGSDSAGQDAAALGDFDTKGWLEQRGVRRWPLDRSCWRRSQTEPPTAGEPGNSNTCLCRGTLTIGGQELLLCQSPHDQPSDSPVPFVTHTVLYSIYQGRMTVVLDRPTNAAVEGCKADRVTPCWLNLVTEADGDSLVVRDAAKRGCDEVLEELDQLIRLGDRSQVRLRAVYRTICDSRGRYSWHGRRLVAAPDALGVRQIGP